MAQSRPYVVLITGAASGIGRCFAQHYLSQPDTFVIAADINEVDLNGRPGQLAKLHVDMSDTLGIQELVNGLRQHRPLLDGGIDLLIHSAGIRGLVPSMVRQEPDDVAAAETLAAMDANTVMRTYQINTMGTFTLLQSLQLAGLFHVPDAAHHTKVMIMTSRMGSISYNTAGGGYAYRASKAALNSIVRSMSIDLPHVVFALVHPGRVETGLTKCREDGAMEVEESVGDMLKLVVRIGGKDSGRFMDRFGADIGW